MSRTVLMTADMPKYSVIRLLISTGISVPSFFFWRVSKRICPRDWNCRMISR